MALRRLTAGTNSSLFRPGLLLSGGGFSIRSRSALATWAPRALSRHRKGALIPHYVLVLAPLTGTLAVLARVDPRRSDCRWEHRALHAQLWCCPSYGSCGALAGWSPGDLNSGGTEVSSGACVVNDGFSADRDERAGLGILGGLTLGEKECVSQSRLAVCATGWQDSGVQVSASPDVS